MTALILWHVKSPAHGGDALRFCFAALGRRRFMADQEMGVEFIKTAGLFGQMPCQFRRLIEPSAEKSPAMQGQGQNKINPFNEGQRFWRHDPRQYRRHILTIAMFEAKDHLPRGISINERRDGMIKIRRIDMAIAANRRHHRRVERQAAAMASVAGDQRQFRPAGQTKPGISDFSITDRAKIGRQQSLQEMKTRPEHILIIAKRSKFFMNRARFPLAFYPPLAMLSP